MPLYQTKKTVIEAFQLTAPNTVEDITGGVGDWLIVDEVGKMHVLSDLQFRERYELAEEEDMPTRFAAPKKRRERKERPHPTVLAEVKESAGGATYE